MPLSKEKKAEILKKLKTVASAKSLAFVNFHGLSAANAILLRRKLKDFGVSYFVAKKTLAKKAFGDAGIAGVLPDLTGELGIAYLSTPASADGGDVTAPAREVFILQKKFENRVSLLGGVFESKFIGMEKAKALALIPSLQTLRAQFVNLINSPLQRLAVVLGAVAVGREKYVIK